jgi:hypothetical protein
MANWIFGAFLMEIGKFFVVWYIFLRFCILCQEQSGNPDPEPDPVLHTYLHTLTPLKASHCGSTYFAPSIPTMIV